MSQQNRLSRIVTPTKARSRPVPKSPGAGGKPSQRRSLSRFTKELERYCVAANGSGLVPLPLSTPTVSESPTTLDTVTEFLPYHKQFKAAGLAVTSREQMPRIPESMHAQMPRNRAARVSAASAAVVQVDGSTVTPSEQETVAPAAPEKEEVGPSNSQFAAQAPTPDSKLVTRSLLPWFRKREPTPASKAHGDRKFSKDHIHPSQATPAGPLLTPSGRLELIDSYFDTPTASRPQDEKPATGKTSLSSPVSSNKSSQFDKPLPRQPPMNRRPIPPRSERRHMENTAEWPTAGVLIHDSSPPRQSEHKLSAVFDADQTASASGSNSLHSWTTEEEGLPDEPERSPPAPPKEAIDTTRALAEEKPNQSLKDVPVKSIDFSAGRRHHQGHSLCNKWYKATGLRRRSFSKPLPMPTPIREEAETPPESDKPRSAPRPEVGLDKPVPQLPMTIPFSVESSSSFEKALDAVISKLDAMEERRVYERKMELETARQALAKPDSREASSKPKSVPHSEPTASAAVPASEDTVEYSDHDIDDRDILLGLKMAICAACDEDLDAWIREKTGLRLRRFLADLKAFESVSKDRKPSPPQPMSRRIRRNGRESRRLQAEQERRRRNSKNPWAHCFGADGQASLPALKRES